MYKKEFLVKREMLARSRTCISMPSTNNSFENHHNYIDYGTLHVDRKKDRHTDEKDRKPMDSISRRPSFSHRKMVIKKFFPNQLKKFKK